MRGVIGGVWFGIWLGCFTAAAVQLPPEVLVDQYLLRADRLMEAKDPRGALEVMGKIVALQKEHGLTLPDEFHFKHGKVAFSAGSLMAAKESVNRFLTVAGRESNFYREALELSIEIGELGAERTPCAGQPKGSACWMELANQPKSYVWNSFYRPYKTVTWTGEYLGNLAHGKGTLKWVVDLDPKPHDASPSHAAEPKCAGQPKGTACWLVVYDQPGCYVWNPNLQSDETVTWSGECAGGRAQGEGTSKWAWEGGEKTSEGKGLLKDGKNHGQWVGRNAQGKEEKSFYVYGEYVGRTAEDEHVMEGRLVKGKRHGDWVERWADGSVGEGPYVDGKRHGDWVVRDADGDVREGPYVDGKSHGDWVERDADGDVREGPYVDGKRHGNWVIRTTQGGRVEGAYVDGKWHGRWVWRGENGDVWREQAYLGGKKHGQWVELYSGGETRYKGSYVDGKKHGDWVESDGFENLERGAYAEGKKHGRWTRTGNDHSELAQGDRTANYMNGTLHGEYVEYYRRDPTKSDPPKVVSKGLYVEGKRHGPWILIEGKEEGSFVHGKRDGPWIEWLEEIPGTLKGELWWDSTSGPYRDDKRHGLSVLETKISTDRERKHYSVNWMRWEGPFVDGKLHGVWRQEASDRTIKGVYYVDGKEQDSWFYRNAVGTTYDGRVVAGKKHGNWTIRTAIGRLLGQGPYAKGKKHGLWDEFYFSTEDHTLYIEGSYGNGKRQGRWNIYRLRDRNKKVRGGGLYVNGSKTGRWVEYKDYYGGKTKYNYGGN